MQSSRWFAVPALIAVLFAGGCATQGAGPQGESQDAGTATAPEPTGLTPDIVEAVLIAELSAQRGDLAQAGEHYLYAARIARSAELARHAARVALFRDDSEAALEATRLWVTLAPADGEAQSLAGLLSLRAGLPEQAREHFLRFLEQGDAAKREERLLQIAALLAKESASPQAVALMREIAGSGPDSANAHQAVAVVALAAREHADAIAEAERALTLDPTMTRAAVVLGSALLAAERTDDAVAAFARAAASAPEDRVVLVSYAQALVKAGRLPEAFDQFQNLNRLQPGQPDLVYGLAVIGYQLRRYEDAEPLFESLRNNRTRGEDADYYLGRIAESRQQWEKALALYNNVQSGELGFEARLLSAGIEARLGRLDAARSIFGILRETRAAEIARIAVAESDAHFSAGAKLEGYAVLDRAVEAKPDSNDLLYARALYAVRIDRVDLLERDLRTLLAREPTHVDALNALGYTLADRTDRLGEAEGYIRKALELEPNNAAILDSMGWVQYRLGRLDVALEYISRAHALLQDSEIAAHLGEVLWATGARDRARTVWNEALSVEPDSEILLRVIDRHAR